MKAPTKGQRFRLPEQLGGGEVEYCWASQVGYGQGWIVTVPGGGPQFDIHPNWLTEIEPTIPAEPEPGAYLIGDVLVARTGDRWVVLHDDRLAEWMNWIAVWDEIGGPDVSIVPLVPKVDLPTVTLPWISEREDPHGKRAVVTRLGGGPSIAIQDLNEKELAGCYVNDAREMAAALLLAAGHKAIEEAGRG